MNDDYDMVTCVICGHKSRSMLGSHLIREHNLTSYEYRDKYNLPTSSQAYKDKRSKVAKKCFSNPETKERLRKSVSATMRKPEVKRRQSEGAKEYWRNNQERRNLQSQYMSDYHKLGIIDDQKRSSEFWERFAHDDEFRHHYLASRSISKIESTRVEEFMSNYNLSNKSEIEQDIDKYLNRDLTSSLLVCPECGMKCHRLSTHMRTHGYNNSDEIRLKYPGIKLYSMSTNTMNRSRHSYVTNKGTLLILRSFLECKICKFLEINKLRFTYENLAIPYYLGTKLHTYLPDFYLPDYNVILEGKPLDRIDNVTEAKREASLALGYNFIYINDSIDEYYNEYLNQIISFNQK